MTSVNDTVLIEHDGHVVIITINRPQTRNAVDAATADALAAAFDGFERDDTVHVAVLTGTGDTFCAGADLHWAALGGAMVDYAPRSAAEPPTRITLLEPERRMGSVVRGCPSSRQHRAR